MQESKKGATTDQSRDREISERQSEATSKDTLKDLEQSEKGSKGKGDDETVPSPDGQPTDRHGNERADGSDMGGPM